MWISNSCIDFQVNVLYTTIKYIIVITRIHAINVDGYLNDILMYEVTFLYSFRKIFRKNLIEKISLGSKNYRTGIREVDFISSVQNKQDDKSHFRNNANCIS